MEQSLTSNVYLTPNEDYDNYLDYYRAAISAALRTDVIRFEYCEEPEAIRAFAAGAVYEMRFGDDTRCEFWLIAGQNAIREIAFPIIYCDEDDGGAADLPQFEIDSVPKPDSLPKYYLPADELDHHLTEFLWTRTGRRRIIRNLQRETSTPGTLEHRLLLIYDIIEKLHLDIDDVVAFNRLIAVDFDLNENFGAGETLGTVLTDDVCSIGDDSEGLAKRLGFVLDKPLARAAD